MENPKQETAKPRGIESMTCDELNTRLIELGNELRNLEKSILDDGQKKKKVAGVVGKVPVIGKTSSDYDYFFDQRSDLKEPFYTGAMDFMAGTGKKRQRIKEINEEIKVIKNKLESLEKEKTPEEVTGEVVERAEGDMDQINSNTEKIDDNLRDVKSLEAKKIRDKNQGVVNEAGEKFDNFKDAVLGNKEKKSNEDWSEFIPLFDRKIEALKKKLKKLKEEKNDAEITETEKEIANFVAKREKFKSGEIKFEDKFREIITFAEGRNPAIEADEAAHRRTFEKDEKKIKIAIKVFREEIEKAEDLDRLRIIYTQSVQKIPSEYLTKSREVFRDFEKKFIELFEKNPKKQYKREDDVWGSYISFYNDAVSKDLIKGDRREAVVKIIEQRKKEEAAKKPIEFVIPKIEVKPKTEAKEKNIDLSFIPDLDEKIEGFEKKIEEKKEEEEKGKPETVMSEPKTETVPPETEKIISEPEHKPESKTKTEIPETEKTAEDLANEKLADEIKKEVDEKKLDEETRERLEEWDSRGEEEKKDEIKITIEGGIDKKTNKKKAGIKEKLGNRLLEREREKAEEIERAKERGEAVETGEGVRLINQENIKKILESRDELVKLRDELDKEAKNGMEKRSKMAEEIKASIDPNNPELAKLNIGEQMMAKEAVSEFLKTTKNVLSVEEIDYLLETGMDNLGDLSETHEERKIEMEELQEIIGAIEEYKKFMERFEEIKEEQREEAREEVGRFVRWLNWVKENKKDLFLVLVAIGVIAGIAAFVSTVGLPAGMSVPAYLTLENAIKAGVGLAAVGAIGYTIKKKKVQAVLKTAGMAVGLPILGAAFIADSILNSKKMDEWMEKICGTKMMFGAGSERKK